MTTVNSNGYGITEIGNQFSSQVMYVTGAGPSSFSVSPQSGDPVLNVTGSGFVYSDAGLVGGTITGVTLTSKGGISETWTNANVSAALAYTALINANWTALYSLFFNGNDSFNITATGPRPVVLSGLNGDDTYNLWLNSLSGITIDGGAGNNTLNLNVGMATTDLAPFNFSNIQLVNLGPGYNYDLYLLGSQLFRNQTMTLDGSRLGASNTMSVVESGFTGSTYGGTLILQGGAGVDTVSFASPNATIYSGVTVNLGLTTAQAVGANFANNVFISIENVIGTGFNDILAGNASDNILNGGSGGVDTADYGSTIHGVTVTLTDSGEGTAHGVDTGNDRLINIENIIGGSGDDMLIGSSGNNVFAPGAGNDVVISNGGSDTVDYSTDSLGVDVNLLAGNAAGRGIGLDSLVGLRRIVGGSGNDVLRADNAGDIINGGAGDDYFFGGAGDDTIIGGTGTNVVDYSSATQPLVISLLTNEAYGSGIGHDQLLNIQIVSGGSGNDVLTNGMYGGTVAGGAGDDTFYAPTAVAQGSVLVYKGDDGDDTFNFQSTQYPQSSEFTDYTSVDGGSGNDTVVFGGQISFPASIGNIRNVETLKFVNEYSYNLVSADATVAAGQNMLVDASNLIYGGGLNFDGSAETDGSFTFKAGRNFFLKGGAGIDTIVLPGLRANYQLDHRGTTVNVTGTANFGSTSSIERFVFDDQTVTFNTHVANDFNADGLSDILWQNSDTGQLSIYLENGSSQLSGSGPLSVNPGPDWHAIGTGDFNGDGKADILFQNSNGQPSYWQMNGTTIADGQYIGGNPGADWKMVTTGDFNGDGKSDILWRNASTGEMSIYFLNGYTILPGSGRLSFDPGLDWHPIATGDLNGDGKADIVFQNDDGRSSAWLMDGSAVLAGSGYLGGYATPTWKVVGTGDFNKDGKSDVLWQNSDTGQMAIYLMDGTSQVSGGGELPYPPGPDWVVKGAEDFNADGTTDIIAQNRLTGQPAIYLVSNVGISSYGSGPFAGAPGTSWHVIANSG